MNLYHFQHWYCRNRIEDPERRLGLFQRYRRSYEGASHRRRLDLADDRLPGDTARFDCRLLLDGRGGPRGRHHCAEELVDILFDGDAFSVIFEFEDATTG